MTNAAPTRTKLPTLLSDEQLQSFRNDGYLVLEGFVDGERCDELRRHAVELVADFQPGANKSVFTTDEQARIIDDYFLDSGDKIRFFFEAEAAAKDGPRRDKALSINKIGHALHDLDPLFDQFSRTDMLRRLVDDFGLEDPRLMQSMYIFKQPFIGGEVNCHQDATFLHTRPDRLLGLWFALEDAHEDNGCLWAIPGGHRSGLKSRFIRDDRRTYTEVYDASPWDLEQLVPLAVTKGALIVLDGLLPHMSHANRSDRSRHAYTLHVISGTCDYPATNWLQRAPAMPARSFG